MSGNSDQKLERDNSDGSLLNEVSLGQEAISFNQDVLKKTAKSLCGCGVSTLLAQAEERWASIVDRLRSVSDIPIGTLSRWINLSWPSTRNDEKLGGYLAYSSPYDIYKIRGFGVRKTKSLLVLMLSLDKACNTEDLDGNDPSATMDIVIPADYVDRVDLFWGKIRESIASSEIANTNVMELAREWGIKWPTQTKKQYTLAGILAANSLNEYVTNSKGLGKNKKPSFAQVLWRAWQHTEPSGPAGPAEDPTETAQEEYEDILVEAGIVKVIERAIEIAGINFREGSILFRRYGLGISKAMTLEEVGVEDKVTRERIRQIQQSAENKIRDHAVSNELTRLALNGASFAVIESLKAYCQSALLTPECDLHKAIMPEHAFLMGIQNENVHQFLDRHVGMGRVHKAPAGWWIGESLPKDTDHIAHQVKSLLLERDGSPLPVSEIDRLACLSSEEILRVLTAAGLNFKMGYILDRKLTAGERRCLVALQLAVSTGQWLWSELEFYRAANSISPAIVYNQRLLLRDVECISGVGIDIPGPYVVINPHAAANVPVDDSIEPPTSPPGEEAEENDDGEDVVWDAANEDTLAGQVQELLEKNRILKYEDLEEIYCEANISSPGSLGPTLLLMPQFIRYAPGYWGIAGMKLEKPDIDQLCSDPNLRAYCRSRKLGGLDELFPFWSPEMEYEWCRWAERFAVQDLYHSLLAVCDPSTWSVNAAIRRQWAGKKTRLGVDRLRPVQPSLDMAYIGFEEVYGLVHLAIQRGAIGPMTIPHFYGLRAADRKAYGTMGLLGAIGVLQPKGDLEAPWPVGERAEEWLNLMSDLLYKDAEGAAFRWSSILETAIEEIDGTTEIGWFSAHDLKASFKRWQANRNTQ